nr:phosphotransferase [Nonomuraea sp. WAC 01424]
MGARNKIVWGDRRRRRALHPLASRRPGRADDPRPGRVGQPAVPARHRPGVVRGEGVEPRRPPLDLPRRGRVQVRAGGLRRRHPDARADLGRHALDVAWTHVSIEEPTSRDWPELAARAAATGQPWADELASHVETFLAIAHFVDTCERPGPVVLTHKDIQPWNLLAREGRPVVLDWELSGMLDLAGELGSTALSLAKGSGFDNIEPSIFRSVLDGYVAGGGALPPSGPGWFVFMIGGWLGFTRWNILRCLAGVEASTGPDLALSHESVRNGVRGLPDMFGRLPELEALLV